MHSQEKEVSELTDEALEHFESLYRKKYAVLPVYANDAGKIALRQFTRNYGLAMVKELLTTFFDMKDPYFTRKGHSLETFKFEISAIQAERGACQKRKVDSSASKDVLRTKQWTWCANPQCKHPQWEIEGLREELDKMHGKLFCKEHEVKF